ncbi:MAG: bifunctional adenosylcobinamide kinase/adenosylcobinamide-phosphate guanylyltransferase [Eubacteriales bacterium]|nr:bifunctional adenosylcobinamide kinase/adenosylcobinamide-phosphate guanylyltransferase [Eubacteriales bacterium]
MELIVGGAFQGKSACARERHPELSWQEGASLSREELLRAGGILNLQDYIRKEMAQGREVSRLGRELLEKNPDAVVTCREVGCGIVPVEAFDRKWREAVGRVCTELAEGSCRVVRVCCGIGTVLKDA